MIGDFQNCVISRIFSVFWSVFFTQNNCKSFAELILTRCLEFKFLIQSEDFAKAIALASWPIFRMVSFLEYLVFS